MVFFDNKIVGLFIPIVFGVIIFHNCIGMDQGVREQKVIHLTTSNNPEPEVIALKKLGLTMGSIRKLKQSDYEVAQQLHIFLTKVNTQDFEKIKLALEDFNKVCKQSFVRIEPYLSDVLKSIIKKRDLILQESSSPEIIKEKLSNLYKIYDLLTQHGAKLKEECRWKTKIAFKCLDDKQQRWVRNPNFERDLFMCLRGNAYSSHQLPLFPTVSYINSIESEENRRIFLGIIFNCISYLHPEYLKKLTPEAARKVNLSLMPDEDKKLIGLFEFLCYQLDIFKRPENMQSLFDDNFDISKFANIPEFNQAGSSEDTEIKEN